MNINNLINKIKRNKLQVLYIWAFIVLVLLIIYFFFVQKNLPVDTSNLQVIEVQMQDNRKLTLNLSANLEASSSIMVYKIKQDQQIQNPKDFFKQFSEDEAFNIPKSDEGYYSTIDAKENVYSYIPNTETFVGNGISNLKAPFSNSTESILQFFKVNQYYQNVSLTESEIEGVQTFRGNTTINGFKVVTRGTLENTFEVQFKENNLEYIRGNFINFEEYEEYPTISLVKAKGLFNQTNYPKEINYTIKGNYMAQVAYPALLSSLSFSKVNVNAVEIVYLLIDKNAGYLIPVYKMKGTSTGTLSDGTELDLDILIYASAIDTEFVKAVEVEDTFEPHLIQGE